MTTVVYVSSPTLEQMVRATINFTPDEEPVRMVRATITFTRDEEPDDEVFLCAGSAKSLPSGFLEGMSAQMDWDSIEHRVEEERLAAQMYRTEALKQTYGGHTHGSAVTDGASRPLGNLHTEADYTEIEKLKDISWKQFEAYRERVLQDTSDETAPAAKPKRCIFG